MDKSGATLTVRKYREDPPTVVPADQWEYIDASTIALSPAGKKSFEPGMVYQFIYPATNPKVIGIGFAAVRDFASFARHSATDADRTANPLAGRIQWAIATGLSQSGRFHRPFLYLGFNQDENGRRVFDGMMPYISGSGGGFFNHRFGQPNRTAFKRLSHVYPEQIFPFAYSQLTDPITGKTDSVLARCEASDTTPKIMERLTTPIAGGSRTPRSRSPRLMDRGISTIRPTYASICYPAFRMGLGKAAAFASNSRILSAPAQRCVPYSRR